MPALVLRLDGVMEDLRYLSRQYQHCAATKSSFRSLMDTHEVGWVVLIFAATGLLVLARSARWRSLTIGFVATSSILYAYLGRYRFQPLRNLLPVLPFLGIAAAVGIVAISDTLARRFHRPRAAVVCVVVLTTAVSAVLVVGGLRSHFDTRLHLSDSRVRAREWLQEHTTDRDGVLIATELAFLPSELRRIHAQVVARSAARELSAAEKATFRFIVVGPSRERG